ncbi:OsmC family protein [Sphingopyxis sp. XHP0097]|uniref:OsmC family protein n=1 Tax=Sphingopyxis jiangsuensis TaxID=2871171 RepID=A0ABS7MCE7_9SPHN|nr:OsmC family protein [Sphingopyxis jiangsuensis]MBY4636683.1 OsmC family protein [Sphingopyxis jiangsuensis]
MAKYEALIEWEALPTDDVAGGKYGRGHRWTFDEGVTVAASSSKHIVPLPWSVEAAVDPEEALVASASSCHMLTFLYIAAKAGYPVRTYRDAAVGTMGKGEDGRLQITRVDLSPEIIWEDAAPDGDTLPRLHHEAHDQCFIANSVKFPIEVTG